MGTDIHAAIEYRVGVGAWTAVTYPSKYFGEYPDEPERTAHLDINRNYNLFAILADVRNGFGFAGCKTGDGFNFISSRRGLPEDISDQGREACSGNHSGTWVDLPELLQFDWEQVATLSGIVTAPVFEHWDRVKDWRPEPTGYCGDRSGPGVREISNEEMRVYIREVTGPAQHRTASELQKLSDRLQTRVEWRKSYAACAVQLWERILPKMLKLGHVHGLPNVRLVMNFDS